MNRCDADEIDIAIDQPCEDILSHDAALYAFSQHQPEKAELVKLRYFAGMTSAEAASALGISTATAERHWRYARAWLAQWIREDR